MMYQHGPVTYSFSCLFSPLILAVVSCIHLCCHHCAALQGGLFCPIIRTQLKCHLHLQITWEENEAWLLGARVGTNQVSSSPSSHFFAQLLEMVRGKTQSFLPTAVHTVQHCFLSLHSTDCETWLGCLWMPPLPCTEVFSFTPFPAAHSTFLLHSCSYRYHTQHSSWSWPEGPQNTAAANPSQFSSLSKAIRKLRRAKKVEGHKYSQSGFSPAKNSFKIQAQSQQLKTKTHSNCRKRHVLKIICLSLVPSKCHIWVNPRALLQLLCTVMDDNVHSNSPHVRDEGTHWFF